MNEEKKQYVLYDYLVYFWSKKIWFVIIPIITALIVAAAVYVLRHDSQKFTGEARVYTGGVKSTRLTDSANIATDYPEADVFVSEKGQVKFTINGKTQGEVQTALHTITKKYYAQLMDNYNKRANLTKEGIAILTDRSEKLKVLNNYYEDYLAKTPLSSEQYKDLNLRKVDAQDNQTKVDADNISMQSDLVQFEQPKVLSEIVHPRKSYIPEGLIVGLILGLLFAIGFLMMLKYMSDARRFYNHD